MSEAPASALPPVPRRSVLDRIRGILTLLVVAIAGFAIYYSLFFERKTTYYSNRNARVIALLGSQIGRTLDFTGRIAANAIGMERNDIEDLYKFKRGLTERPPQAIYDKIEVRDDKVLKERSLTATRKGDLVTLTYEQPADGKAEQRFVLAEAAANKAKALERKNEQPKPEAAGKSYAHAEVELRRLIDPMVRQAATGVFNTVFIIDRSGDVVYQWTKQRSDASEAELKIVRLSEIQAPRLFEGDVTMRATELMAASRQMVVRIGDRKYRLFSVPIRSGVQLNAPAGQDAEKNDDSQKALAGFPSDLWVVCGAVAGDEFRAQSLALSATLLCCLGAAVLLMVCSWPFLKMTLSSAQQKITLVDVILAGLGGIMAMSVFALVVLDGFAYRKLEWIADGQLKTFSSTIERHFVDEVDATLAALDKLEQWTEEQIPNSPATRNVNMLASFTPSGERLLFQSVALLGNDGRDDRQRVKWVVDKTATPLIPVSSRNYYFATLNNGREAIEWRDGRRMVIESVRSLTTGQPEVVFARETGFTDPVKKDLLPVIALSSAPASLINTIVPDGFGFAIIDDNGTVLFHSLSARNTVENFFAETDEDPRVRSAVQARQSETMDIHYLGEDYTAFVRPLRKPPWTLITFRQKQQLRMLNTEALLITIICLFAVLLALVAFIGMVLLFRPWYRADWLWPDPKRLASYGELAAAYVAFAAAALAMLLVLHGGALLLFPFAFVPFVLTVTYLYLRPRARGPKWMLFSLVNVVSLLFLVRLSFASWLTVVAAILFAIFGVRAIVRRPETFAAGGRITLPLRYVWAGSLLLLLASTIPTAAFFKAAYQMEMDSYVKWVQMKLSGDLSQRWSRVRAEFSEQRGVHKSRYLDARWNDFSDVYAAGAFGTRINALTDAEEARRETTRGHSEPLFPELIEPYLPHYSESSVDTRELVHDETADDLWRWRRLGGHLTLSMRARIADRSYEIDSVVPQLLPSADDLLLNASMSPFFTLLAVLAIGFIAFAIARFLARRVFLVDLVQPLALSEGYVGLRHVICHPCDDDSARRLFRNFKTIALTSKEGLELAATAPQSFEAFETAVFVDGVGHSFADGENSKMLRALLDRLTRNSDRTVVLRPASLTVITRSFLQGHDGKEWREALMPFVWVNWSQVVTTGRKITLSGPMPAIVDDGEFPKKRSRWQSLYELAGFGTYFQQITDPRGEIRRTLKRETDGDPYLETMISGWTNDATGRDQVLDEIGERAEEYYAALWHTCTPHEQFVLMQLAQTGLANFKARKHVRRLLARGHIRRDPQLRLMNETFRRFVLAQGATSGLAEELETHLAGDAWNRFRMPLFASVAVVLLFFFMTQRQMFDSTIALVTGLAASLPAFINMVSRFGNRGSRA